MKKALFGKNLIKKITAAFMVVILLIPYCSAIVTLGDNKSDLQDAQNQQNNIQNKKKETEDKIAKLKKESTDLNSLIQGLDAQMGELSASLDDINTQIEQLEAEIEETEAQLEQAEIDKESVYTKNKDVDYYEECPLFYTFSKKEITETDKIQGLTANKCFDKDKNEYYEIEGLSDIYVKKQDFEKKCYENALNWESFFDNQEEFEDDIFCDKLSLLKKIDKSSVIKNIFKRRMITDDEMKMFFGPNDHSLEMKDVVRNLRKIECKHPLEFDKAKFEKISDEYNKRKEWTMGAMSEAYANELKVHAKIRDIWTDGLCKIFKKNNFFFVHPIYFLNHLDKAGLFEFNPYEGFDIVVKSDYNSKTQKKDKTFHATGSKGITHKKVQDNPGFAPITTSKTS